MARYDSTKTKKIIPDRLVNYLLIKYYRKRILDIGINNIFLQRQESLLALSDCKGIFVILLQDWITRLLIPNIVMEV